MRSATKTVASWVGVVAGVMGMEHGYFEMLQGHVTPGSLVISAFGPPCQVKAVWHGCEPAMTIIPDFFVTGILAMIVSFIVLLWAIGFVQRKHGGAVLILLSGLQLLVGGGFVPPVFGIIAGATASRIKAPLTWWRARLGKSLHFLAKLGLWPLVVLLVWTPTEWLLGSFFNEFMLNLAMPLLIVNLGLILLAIVAGFAYDIERRTNSQQVASTGR